MQVLGIQEIGHTTGKSLSAVHGLQLLTEEELDQAAGGFWPVSVIGGALGGASYSWNNSNWTPGGFMVAVAFGAGGAAFGALASSVGWGTFGAAAGGVIGAVGGGISM
jgi:hypothetical protein